MPTPECAVNTMHGPDLLGVRCFQPATYSAFYGLFLCMEHERDYDEFRRGQPPTNALDVPQRAGAALF